MITNVRTKGLDKNLPDTLKFPYQRIKHKKIRRQEVLYLMLNITNLFSLILFITKVIYVYIILAQFYYDVNKMNMRISKKKVSKLSKACISKIRYFKCTFLSI